MSDKIAVFSFRSPDDSLHGSRLAPRKATRRAIELLGLTPIADTQEWVDASQLDSDEFVRSADPLPEPGPVTLRSTHEPDAST